MPEAGTCARTMLDGDALERTGCENGSLPSQQFPEQCRDRQVLRRIQAAALDACRRREQLPPWRQTDATPRRDGRYPFERDLTEYCRKLPGLIDALRALPQGGTVLDIGAGNGMALAELSDRFGHRVLGTGIQPVSEPLCPFVVCNAASLPFQGETFDLVISVHGISWEPDQVGAIGEVMRVLRRDGNAFVCLRPFSYPISVYHGESFWDEVGVPVEVYKHLGVEFSPSLCEGRSDICVVRGHGLRGEGPGRACTLIIGPLASALSTGA